MPDPHESLQDWLSGARALTLPFAVPLADPQGSELVCERLLRLLPGRRLVARARWQGQVVLAKLFVADDRLNERLSREAEGIRALQEAGIPTPALLAQGMTRCARAGLVLTEFIESAEDFSTRWLRSDAADHHHLLEQLAATLVAMHEAGLYQADAHLGNFLVAEGDAMVVIDAAAIVRAEGPLDEHTAVANLALMVAQWPLSQQATVLPLFRHYAARRHFRIDEAAFAAQAWQAWRRRTADFLAKTLRDCTQFAVQEQPGVFASLERERDGLGLQSFLRDPDAFMKQGSMIKDGNSATVVRVMMDGREVVIKRYNIKDRLRFLRRAWRCSRARNAWLSAWLLSYAGVPTPRPVCLLEHRRFGMNGRAWLVTEAAPGEPLEARHVDAQPALVAQVAAVIEAIGHGRISHGDMKSTNFLADGERLAVIDLDAMRWHRCPWRARKELRHDVDRFLRNWRDRPALQRLFREALKPWL